MTYIKDFCDYYGYNYFEESDDPYYDKLIDSLDYYAQKGKYYMTYEDLKMEIDSSYSTLTKKILQYIESGDILRFGSKNKAEFVLPKYERLYKEQKQKIDILTLKENLSNLGYEWEKYIEYHTYIINLNIYLEKLQIKVVSPATTNFNLYERFQCECNSNSNPIIIPMKETTNNNFEINYKFLFYKSGKILIYVDFSKAPKMVADQKNLKDLFCHLRRLMLYPNANFMPPSFIISQFNGYRHPFKDRSKQKIIINKSFNLPTLLQYLSYI
jgi:hypothetical protein